MSREDVDWATVHEKLVEQFSAGWDHPDPHGWDAFLGADMEFVQPLLRRGTGPEFWAGEAARTLALVPDLRADVLSWAGSGDTLFIHLRFVGTLAGRPISWEAVDLLRVSPDGTATFRESFFDSGPVAAQVVRRPTAWLRWWRSGVGPVLARRRLWGVR
jgi:hypothetical protein